MKIGIIGPPQSGKSTMFKILLQADTSSNIGVFKVKDSRMEKLSEILSSKKRTPPEFTFIDLGAFADLDKKKDLLKFQDIDLFICVVGAFLGGDAKKDFESILTDILLADLDIIQTRISRLEKERSPELERQLKVLNRCYEAVSEGRPLWKVELSKEEIKLLSGIVFLSSKPIILAINVSEGLSEIEKDSIKSLKEYSLSKDIKFIEFSGKIELELLELEPQERESFLKELEGRHDLREDISKLITNHMGLITFFTAGDKETRGWFLKSGLSVIEAAGKIHTDIERGFIRAEVVNYEDFLKYGSIPKAREEGKFKVEGKDYIVKDGDIINIRFNV